jgi:hypothetical protein
LTQGLWPAVRATTNQTTGQAAWRQTNRLQGSHAPCQAQHDKTRRSAFLCPCCTLLLSLLPIPTSVSMSG